MADKKKASPDSVKAVQKFLKEQGFYKGDISGIKTWGTEAAIRAYQIQNKLKNTGEIDDVPTVAMSKSTPAPQAGGSAQPQASAPATAPQANPNEGIIAPTPRRGGGGVQVPADAPGVADFMAGIRGIVKPEMDAAAAANQAALVDAARKEGFGQGEKWAQQAADQKKQDAAAGKNPPVFLSEAQLARYNNSVKWAEAGMSPRQIFDKHAKTTYSQPGNVAADISGLPATFLEDNNFTLKPPEEKGKMGGMSTEGQWNKLFPNRAGTPDMPNAGARAPAEPLKPGDAVMHALIPNWALVSNEDPDRLRIRRADLLRNQQFIDSRPGWHEGNPNGTDLVGTEFSQTGDTTRELVAPEFGGKGSATNVPKVPDIWKLPSAPPAADQPVADAEKPPVNPNPNAAVPDLSGLKLPK